MRHDLKEQHCKTSRVSDGGRIVIPAEFRKRLGLEVGTEIVVTVADDQVTIISAKAARRRAQQRVRQYVDKSVSLSKELMAERKEEAAPE